MKTIWIRLTAESPTFFKKLTNLSLAIGGAGGVVLGLPATLATMGVAIAFPPVLLTIAGYAVAAGAVAAAVGKMTVADSAILPTQKEKEKE